MSYNLKKIIILTLVIKLSLLILMYLTYHFLPFFVETHDANFIHPPGETANMYSVFKTWDANHYLYLAEQGYTPHHISNAYYPLFPFLIHIMCYVFLKNTFITGLVLSHAFAIAAIIYLYLFTNKLAGEETAYNACLLFLAFPTSFFIGLIYTESLFLTLSIALFYYLYEKKNIPALICSFLLPLTRPTGFLVIIPTVIAIYFNKEFQDSAINQKISFKKLIVPMGFIAGFAFYLLLMNYFTGDSFAGFEAQGAFFSDNTLRHIINPIDWVMKNYINISYSITGVANSILNRIAFIIYLFVLFLSYRHLNQSLFAYAAIIGIIPALSGNLMSYMRYLVVIFPLFIYLALKIKTRLEYYVIPSLILQTLFTIVHSLNYWIA